MTIAVVCRIFVCGRVVFLQVQIMQAGRKKPLERRIAERINKKKANVFVRSDFEDLAGYDQVGRALRRLVAKGRLVKIGHGLYARATTAPISGKTVPNKNLPALATEALRRLRVPMAASEQMRAYNAGKTTQVPTGRVIAVKKRVSRKIGYDGKFVTFERARAT